MGYQTGFDQAMDGAERYGTEGPTRANSPEPSAFRGPYRVEYPLQPQEQLRFDDRYLPFEHHEIRRTPSQARQMDSAPQARSCCSADVTPVQSKERCVRFKSPLPKRSSCSERHFGSRAHGRRRKLLPGLQEVARYAFCKVYHKSVERFDRLADWTSHAQEAIFNRSLDISARTCDKLFAPLERFLGLAVGTQDRAMIALFAAAEAYAVFLSQTIPAGVKKFESSGVCIVSGLSAVNLWAGFATILGLMCWSLVDMHRDLKKQTKDCPSAIHALTGGSEVAVLSSLMVLGTLVCPILHLGNDSGQFFVSVAILLPFIFVGWVATVKHLVGDYHAYDAKKALQSAEKEKEAKIDQEVRELRQIIKLNNTIIQDREERLQNAREQQLAAEDGVAYLRLQLSDAYCAREASEYQLDISMTRIANFQTLESQLRAENSQLTSAIGGLNAKCNAITQQLSDACHARDANQHDLDDSTTRIADFEATESRLRTENALLTSAIKNLHAQYHANIQQLDAQQHEANHETLRLQQKWHHVDLRRLEADIHAGWEAYHHQELGKLQATSAREKGSGIARAVKSYEKQMEAFKGTHLGELRNAWTNVEFFHRKHAEAEAKLQKLQQKLQAAEQGCELLDEQDIETAIEQDQRAGMEITTRTLHSMLADNDTDTSGADNCLGQSDCTAHECLRRNTRADIIDEEPVDVLLDGGLPEAEDLEDMEFDLVSLNESDCESVSEVELSSDAECDGDFHA